MRQSCVLKPLVVAAGIAVLSFPSFTHSTDGTASAGTLPASSAVQAGELAPLQLPGSGEMRTTDRTGSTGLTGSEAFSISSGAVDAIARVAKPYGDEAATDTDRDLAARIRVAIEGDPDLAPWLDDRFHLRVDNGVVTMLGAVRSREIKEQITIKVTELAGHHEVEDRLVIAPH